MSVELTTALERAMVAANPRPDPERCARECVGRCSHCDDYVLDGEQVEHDFVARVGFRRRYRQPVSLLFCSERCLTEYILTQLAMHENAIDGMRGY